MFSVALKNFYQLYTIHSQVGTYNSQILPLVYVLLTKKTTDIYKEMFEILIEITKEKKLHLNP